MPVFRYRIVNVFVPERLRGPASLQGNPLCVFEDARGLDGKYPPAKPGALVCEPLEAACQGSLTRPLRSSAPLSGALHFHSPS